MKSENPRSDYTSKYAGCASISVIVCTYRSPNLLQKCLTSVLDSDYPREKYEVIVIDDGLLDSTEAICKRFLVKLIRQNDLGLGAARNAGIRESNGEIVAFVDDDAYVTKDWLKQIDKDFHSDESLACLGGLDPASEDDPYFGKCAYYQDEFFRTKLFFLKHPLLRVRGCNMAFRKTSLEDAGLFNQSYRGFEDTELLQRMNDKGMKIAFNPGLVVYHHRGGFRKILEKFVGKGLYTWKYTMEGYGRSYKVHYLTISIVILLLLSGFVDFSIFVTLLSIVVFALICLSATIALSIPRKARFIPGIFVVIVMQSFFTTLKGVYSILTQMEHLIKYRKKT